MFLHISCKYTYKLVEKTWLLPIISLEEGSMLFTPQNYLVVPRKKWCSSETPEFLRGDPYELGRMPLQPMKIYKSQLLSRGVLVIQTSWICLNMAKHVINVETVCLFLWYFGSTSKHYSFRDPFQLLYQFWTYFVISIGIIPFLLAKQVKLIRSDTFSTSCIYKCFVKLSRMN